jgi:hypothetical protein
MFPKYFTLYDFADASYGGTACSPFYGGVNGGFSLRKRDAMIECIRKVSFEQMCEYNGSIVNNPHNSNEDVFFTHACEILKKTVPDEIHRSFLSIEMDYNLDTSVIHRWNIPVHSAEMVMALLAKSPLFSKYIHIQKS